MDAVTKGHPTLEEMEGWPELLTPNLACRLLGCDGRTLRFLAAEGAIPAVKVGRRWKFPKRRLMAACGLIDAA